MVKVMEEPAMPDSATITVKSSRFGEFEVPSSTVIEFPRGMIGFPNQRRYIMLEHRGHFCWLQSIDEPSLAFVVIDGMGMEELFDRKIPFADPQCDFQGDDEFAILLIVTVRQDPTQTTANVKAPVFVNMRNRRGVQVIYDDPSLDTRYPLFSAQEDAEQKS
jgi:flagellar assembly factor FliW